MRVTMPMWVEARMSGEFAAETLCDEMMRLCVMDRNQCERCDAQCYEREKGREGERGRDGHATGEDRIDVNACKEVKMVTI